jgi:MFS family permease
MQGIHFCGIDLSEGIKRRHLVAYLIAAFISSGYAGALAVLQPGLLQVMEIPFAEQAILTGNLSALQEVVFILLMSVMGALSDRVGRRPVYVFGLLTTALGFTLYPHAETLTELVAYRLIVAVGGAAMVGMMVTVIADYSQDKTRGKANGLQGVVATLGAFIPPVLGALPAQFVASGYSEAMAQQLTFGVGGALGLFGAIVAFIGLAPKVAPITQEVKESFFKLLKVGFHAGKDPQTALSYGAAFISRGDLAVTGAFMSLWLMQWGTRELGMSPSEAMFQLAVPRVLAVVTGALIGSVLMGWLADKVSRVVAVALASGLAGIIYLAVFFVSDPTSDWFFGLLFIMGIAEISAFVSSQVLVGQQAPAQQRGAVFGFFGVSGAVGILVGTAGGGWLFASIGPSTPFVLFGCLNALVCLWAIFLNKKLRTHAA